MTDGVCHAHVGCHGGGCPFHVQNADRDVPVRRASMTRFALSFIFALSYFSQNAEAASLWSDIRACVSQYYKVSSQRAWQLSQYSWTASTVGQLYLIFITILEARLGGHSMIVRRFNNLM